MLEAMKSKSNTSLRAILTISAVLLGTLSSMSGGEHEDKSAKAGKLYHIGLVWLKEPGNAEQRQKLIAAAHAFSKEIAEVEFLSVGKSVPQTSGYTDASFDICFVMRLNDKAAMDRYGAHPVHQKAAHELFLPFAKKILFYDFASE
jgi:hypothetical protein